MRGAHDKMAPDFSGAAGRERPGYQPNFSAQIGPIPLCFHSLRRVALQMQQVPVVWP